MGDTIPLDWGTLGTQPNPNAFMQGYNNARTIAMQHQADQARNDALANPSDMNALTKFAVFDPQGADAVKGMLNYQMAGRAREAMAQSLPAILGQQSSYQPPQSVQQPAQGVSPPAGALPPVTPGASFQNAFAPVAQQGMAPPPAQQAPQQSQGAAALTDPAHPVAQQIGQAALSGQISPAQAWASMARFLDPDTLSKMVTSVGGMHELQMKQITEANNALGSEAQNLLSVPLDQRPAALQQMAPYLAQHGVTQQQIQQALQAGVSDQFLHGVIGQVVGTTGLIEQANKERGFGQKDAEIGIQQQTANTGAFNAQTERQKANWEQQKPVSVGISDALVDPKTGRVVYDPMGSSGGGDVFTRMIGAESGGAQLTPAGGPVTSPKGAIGIAQVMPGTGPEAAKYAGVAWDPVKYRTDAAYNATIGRAYFDHLVQQFGGDQAKAVAAYNAGAGRVQQAVAQGGAAWQQHLPAETQAYVQKVMAGGGGGMGGLIETQAQAIARGDQAPFTNRAAASGIGARVMGRVFQINPNYDAKDYKGNQAAVVNFDAGKLSSNVRSISVAMQHLDTLGQAGAALQNGDVRMFNSVSQHLAAAVGKPAPTNFDGVKQIVAAEVVKAIVGSGGGVQDRLAAEQIFSKVNSPAQLSGAISQVKALLGGQLDGLRRQYVAGTGGKTDFDKYLSPAARALGGGSTAPASVVAVNSPDDAAKLPPGTRFRTPDGRVLTRH